MKHEHKYMETEIDGRYSLVCECGKPVPENGADDLTGIAVPHTDTPGEPLKELRRTFQSTALAVFRDRDGGRVAYGWTWNALKPLIQAEISNQREQARQEGINETLDELARMKLLHEFSQEVIDSFIRSKRTSLKEGGKK